MKGTALTIHLKNLSHNYTYLRSRLAPEVKMLGVVKAFAYGSDAIAVARHLAHLGMDYLGVAYAEEGAALRAGGITLPILVMHPQSHNLELLISQQLEPNIYSLRMLQQFEAAAAKCACEDYPIHIKYNSGLNRLGFSIDEIPKIHPYLTSDHLQVKALFSHLAASEDKSEKAFSLQQIEAFNTFTTQISQYLSTTPLRHQCNTSGILNFPEAHFNMVRTGIGLYGFGNDPVFDKYLKPVASLTSVISQIHEIPKGASVGYNRGFIATKAIRSATIAIGHADGIGRIYGQGKGFVWINDKKAPILGNVCMDILMVDVTTIDCKEGDQVVVFDSQSTAAALAEAAGTISYELITGIGARVKRILTDK